METIRLRVLPALIPPSVELDSNGDVVRWRYVGQDDSAWVTLIEYADLATTVTLGTVETVPPGTPAYVENAGTTKDLILNFGIPAGLNAREVLTGSRTYYVRPNGNDANSGLVDTDGGAFKTLQRAWDNLANIDQAGFGVGINIADGTYTAGLSTGAHIPDGDVFITGNTGTPANVVISTTNANALLFDGPMNVTLVGVKLQTTTAGGGLTVRNHATVNVGSIVFGACANDQTLTHNFGSLNFATNYSIVGGSTSGSHHHVHSGGQMSCTNITVTLTGTPSFGGYFCGVAADGEASYVGTTISGSATGQRFLVHSNGYLATGGQGLTFLPGSVAGSFLGGNYDDKVGVAGAIDISSSVTIKFGGNNVGMTWTLRDVTYAYLQPNVIMIRGRLVINAKGSSTGAATISGLPVAAAGPSGITFHRTAGMTSAPGLMGYISGTDVTLLLDGASSSTAVTEGNFNGGSDLMFSGIYFV